MLIRRKPFLYLQRKRRRGPERCPAYLAWIRTLRCAVCGRGPREHTRVEAAHTSALGPRGLGQKSSDYSAIPLCSWDHSTGPDSYHRLGERLFAAKHAIDLSTLVVALNQQYRTRGRGGTHER
jgi:hypothetical protein